MPLENLLDPQGKAVKNTLHNLKYNFVSDVRIGKHIVLTLEAEDEENAKTLAEQISRKLLANQVMEYFRIEIRKL